MPNWCDNSVTLYHEDKTKIDALAEEMNKKNDEGRSMACPFNHLRPQPPEVKEGDGWYEWNCSNWGSKWDADIIDWDRQDDNTIWICFNSAWSPPIALYNYLTEEGWKVDAMYHESGMSFAGMYSDGIDDYYEYDITDPDFLDHLPSDIVDFAGLEDAHRDWVISNLGDEWEGAERTEWFKAKTKPVNEGWYEVTTKGWNFPHFMEFKNGEWDTYDPKIVIKWRGLAQDPNWDPVAELDKIVNED